MRSSRWLSAEPLRRLASAGLGAVFLALGTGCAADRSRIPLSVSSLTVDVAPLRDRGAGAYADAAAGKLAAAAREVFALGSGPRVVLVLDEIRLASYGEEGGAGETVGGGIRSSGPVASRDDARGFVVIDGRAVPMLVSNTVQPSFIVDPEVEARRIDDLMRVFAGWSRTEAERAGSQAASGVTRARSARP
jgi:hypothetical protein